MIKILITGGPRTGKTTLGKQLAEQYNVPLLHTDDAIEGRSWSEASAEVATWIERDGPWIIEGVAVPRTMRKCSVDALSSVSEIIIRTETFEALTPGQISMTKGVHTVLGQVLPSLPDHVKVTRS